MSTCPDTDKYLTVAEIVERFGVSERTARRHRAKGTLPSENRRKAMRHGKVYTVPAEGNGKRLPPLAHRYDLPMARAAIRRVLKAAHYYNEHDVAMAQEIMEDISLLLYYWKRGA